MEKTAVATESKPHLWKWTAIIALIVGVPSAVYSAIEVADRFTQTNGPRIVSAAKVSYYEKALTPGSNSIQQAHQLEAGWYLSVVLENRGNLVAENARLQVGSSGVAAISRVDGKLEVAEFTNVVDLGDLLIEETANVSVWVDGDDPRPNVRSMTVGYRNGSTSVESSEQQDFGIWKLVNLVLAGSLTGVCLAIVSIHYARRQQDRAMWELVEGYIDSRKAHLEAQKELAEITKIPDAEKR